PIDHPMMFPPVNHAGEAACVACHAGVVFPPSSPFAGQPVTCAICHIDPATKNEHPAGMAPPTTAAGEVSCTNCHIQTGHPTILCANCHPDPWPAATPTPAPTPTPVPTATPTPTPTPVPGQKADVTFKVTDSATGKPIENAIVLMDGIKIVTNDHGIAVFKMVAFGKHTYSVTKEKYLKAEGKINVKGKTTVYVKLKKITREDHDHNNEEHN
ncbi:MAG TPA: hypothetical protein VKL21_02805, partial [Candidatus Methanoperedens sp.]|nr:hypothetical protein [Candidatus Methanoperedens sp.]